MGTFTTVTRSLRHHYTRRTKPNISCHIFSSVQLTSSSSSNSSSRLSGQQHHQYQSRRSLLILDSLPTESVKLNRLSDSDSGIVEVSLDRPAARNAIGKEMLRGLRHTFEMINEDESARVVMFTSSVPKAFCAGADLKERKAMTVPEIHFFVNTLRSATSYIEVLRIPTIAVIEGAALGGGLELALSCDLRICGEAALLGMPETGLAIIPGAGGTQRLPRLVGRSVAKDLIFTGRKIGGREAMSMGLVNYCVPAGEARSKALEIAREIIQKGPIGIRMAKKAINEGVEVDLASGLKVEEECYAVTLSTKDRLEALAAFVEKRKPKYKGE